MRLSSTHDIAAAAAADFTGATTVVVTGEWLGTVPLHPATPTNPTIISHRFIVNPDKNDQESNTTKYYLGTVRNRY